ncbi:hypothetical protein BU17DRAFT_82674 [Hysterangium stoloniferum]|nr:hypothetical protein BU17DRAFT_82674 [Hysterangium stoloniferum]
MTVRVPLAQSTFARPGRNLADRHARLIREPVFPQDNVKPCHDRQTTLHIFRGLLIPRRPRPPSAEDCCMARCKVCVHDLYFASLQQHHRNITQFRSTLDDLQVPRQDWPSEIKGGDTYTDDRVNMKEEEQAAAAFAQRAFQAMDKSAKDPSTKLQDVALEAAKLVLWVLRGCPG